MLTACTFVLYGSYFSSFVDYLQRFYSCHLCLHICALHRRTCIQARPSALFHNVLNLSILKMLALICFPEVKSSLSRISYFPCKPFCISLLAGRNLLRAPTSRSSICHPSDSANSSEHCSRASRGVDAADGHVLGVAVKQASNGTPYNHSKGGHASPVLTQEMLWLATW